MKVTRDAELEKGGFGWQHAARSTQHAARSTQHAARARRTVRHDLIGLTLFGAVIGAVGCGNDGRGDAETFQQSAYLQSTADLPCVSQQVIGAASFDNISTKLLTIDCQTSDGRDEILYFDPIRNQFEVLDNLIQDDADAFKMVYHAIAPGVREDMDAAGQDGMVRADVWFYPNIADLIVAQDEKGWTAPEEEEFVKIQQEARTRAQAVSLAPMLEALGLEVLSDVRTPGPFIVPYLQVRGKPTALEAAGELPEIWQIAKWREPAEGSQADNSEYYFWVDGQPWLDNAGWDGSGKTVAIYELSYPNWRGDLPGWPTGSCPVPGASSYKCHCPSTSGGISGNHSRYVMGAVRSSFTTFGGTADEVTTIAANYSGTCTSNGPDVFASALNWAFAQGAKVVNCSDGVGHTVVDDTQWSPDLLIDYFATVSPYPVFTYVTANGGASLPPTTWLRNGIIVGGANASNGTDRAAAYWDTETQPVNPGAAPGSASGWELPHLVAPSIQIRTARNSSGADAVVGGTSVAAPQVAAVAASIHELYPSLEFQPGAVFVGLLVGANDNTDDDWGGPWPLNTHDGIDDKDGAGLMNAFATAIALDPSAYRSFDTSPQTPDPAFINGHYASIETPGNSTWTVGTSRYWWASIDPGATLRVAAHFLSKPTCGNPPSNSNCSTNPYPQMTMWIRPPNLVGSYDFSSDSYQNYQFVSYKNTTASTVTVAIEIRLNTWGGVSTTRFAMAWLSSSGS